MPINYARLNSTATRLIRDNGKTVVIKSITEGAYDVNTGTSTDVVTESSAKAVQVMFDDKEIDGTNVLASDVKLMMEPNVVEPKINDLCVFDGVQHTIKNVKKTKPASIVMFYYLYLRK